MFTSNKLKKIAVKKIFVISIFIFFIISLCSIIFHTKKYNSLLIQQKQEENKSLKQFAEQEEESKLRISQWSHNKVKDFRQLNEIVLFLDEAADLLHKPIKGDKEIKEILVTPGNEYKNRTKDIENNISWSNTNNIFKDFNVNYNFGTFVPSQEMINNNKDKYNKDFIIEDKRRFASFIEGITSLVSKNTKKGEKNDLQKRTKHSNLMFETLGISEDVDKHFPELDILWIYIGSSEGAFATFPGNSQEYKNNGKPYNPTNRPWFEEAVNKNNKGGNLFNGHENIGLSSVYDDYSEHLDSVRTLWRTVDLNSRKYVIGIDFYLGNNAFNISIPDLSKKNNYSIIDTVIIQPIKGSLIFSFIFFIVSLLFIKYGTLGLKELLVFGLTPYKQMNIDKEIYAKFITSLEYDDEPNKNTIELSEINKSQDKQVNSKKISAETPEKTISLSLENIHTKEKNKILQVISNHQMNPLNTAIRGKEFWKITKSKKLLGNCPTCEEPIKLSTDEDNLDYIMVIKHTAQDMPEVLPWSNSGENPPPKWIKSSLIEHVLKSNYSIKQSKNSRKILSDMSPFDIPYQLKGYVPLMKMHQAYTILQSGRYNSENIINLSRYLYENSNVKAVCRVGYFKRLLELGEKGDGFLYIGDRIERIIIAFNTEEFDSTKEWFEKEGKKKIMPSAQVCLYIINVLDLPKGLREYRKWDFAIVDSSRYTDSHVDIDGFVGGSLVITSDYSDQLDEDKLSGMVSWRFADVTFYETLYRTLNRNKGEENILYIPK